MDVLQRISKRWSDLLPKRVRNGSDAAITRDGYNGGLRCSLLKIGGEFRQADLARFFDVNSGHINVLVRQGAVTPTLLSAAAARPETRPIPKRPRISFELRNKALRPRIEKQCEEMGVDRADWLEVAAQMVQLWLEEKDGE